ncbi:MAG: leucyl aminopeptidase [Actinomycetota bacterium]
MEFAHATGSATGREVDLLVLPLYEGPEAGPGVKDVRGVDLVAFARAAQVRGRVGDTLLVPNAGVAGLAARAVLLVGVGPRADAGTTEVRRAAGRAAKRLGEARSVATTLPQVAARAGDDAVQAVVEGFVLGAYRFDRYKSRPEGDARAKRARGAGPTVTLLGPARTDGRAAAAAIRRGSVIAEAQNWARDLVNTPALDLPPAGVARAAQQMARAAGLTCKVWTERQLEAGGFGGILGVGRGSDNPPRMIELRYDGGGPGRPIALSGKGIAFDSGGLSIKDATSMETMKDDMAGAASILATMKVLAELRPKVNVIAAIPCAENMSGGSAIHPGDVLTHRGGTTSEVLNTDAEGRLVLADALAFLAEQEPRCIIDTATLTGAMSIALGDQVWGVMGNDRRLIDDVLAAGEAVGEPGWELPLWKGYRPYIDSHIADIRNTGKKARTAGSIVAAWFLAEFVGDTPWAHLDIAGTAYGEEDDLSPKGATGSPIRTLVRYILGQAGARRR